ncbi:hypothetical protein EDB89DRAFT_2026567 [Lactarius sanguifluus]|nr:hypothetical protein EDB89DRAFT_2026567 [Lactarius sanguifluus]
MAQVCVQFSPFLFGVNNLRIKAPQSSGGQDDVDSEQWLELVRAFGSVTDFQVADKLSTGILCALGRVGGGHATVLPSLRLLHIENPLEMDEPSWGGLLSFIALRSLSGHPVQVNVPSYQCHICHAGFRLQQGLESHVKKHTYRIVCSYCDFECTVGHNGLFRTHLAKNHPDVALDDALSSDPPSTSPLPLQLDGFVNRHSSLRAPDIVALHHGHGAPPIASVV